MGLTISTPEGWSRTNSPGAVTFTDKLNKVQLFTVPAKGPLTVAAAQAAEIPKIATSVKSFKLQSVTIVSRRGARAVRVAYLGDSRPDPVTGKVGTLAFERYDFFHGGREVVAAGVLATGIRQRRPVAKITDSLTFTR